MSVFGWVGVEVEQFAQGQGHATNKEFYELYAQVCTEMSMINMVSCYENVTF